MAMTPEAKVKALLDKMFKEEGVYYFCPATGGYGKSGVHDRVGCVSGHFFSVECKPDTDTPMTALQAKNAKEITEEGGTFFLVYDKATIEQVRQFIHHARS